MVKGIQSIVKDLGIGDVEKFTQPRKEKKVFTKVADNIPQQEDKSLMADLLELPNTKQGYHYLLVVVDLWSREIEFQQLKTKEAAEVKKALIKIFNRGIVGPLKSPAQLQTDGGSEFKGVFHKYIFDKNVYHKKGLPYRHSQNSTVERANRTLGRLFTGYMNKKELETGKTYNEWTDIVDVLRDKLNDPSIRVIRPDKDPTKLPDRLEPPPKRPPQRYKQGDLVHRKLDYPENIFGKKQPTAAFRMGDVRYERANRKVVKVIPYQGAVPWRYMLEGLDNVSYPANQLIPSELQQEVFRVKELIGRRQQGGKYEYKVWWEGEPKAKASWEPKENLTIDPVLKKAVEFYDKNNPLRRSTRKRG